MSSVKYNDLAQFKTWSPWGTTIDMCQIAEVRSKKVTKKEIIKSYHQGENVTVSVFFESLVYKFFLISQSWWRIIHSSIFYPHTLKRTLPILNFTLK